MANPEHVERLKRSVWAWNEWREAHPEVLPDLSEAHLSGADLNRADLSGADFSKADLSNASLNNADLSFANLSGAYLSFARLSRADLSKADLSFASLSETHLTGTILSSTVLVRTNFTHVYFGNTSFTKVNLSIVKGLSTARHFGPSIVDINSVILPHDEPTRLHFLRGIGFTDTQIEYLPSLLAPRPIQYHSLFISYASQDEAIAQQLYTDLRKKDIPCWFAPHDMKIGDKTRPRIDEAIHTHDKLLLILSEYSVASQWVEHEVETALSKENEGKPNVLFPIRLDDAVMKSKTGWASHVRLTRHIGDFTRLSEEAAYQEAFSRLLRDLKVSKLSTR